MDIHTARVILMILFVGVSGSASGCATIVHLGGSEELNVTSEPPMAKVIVDGAERGVTPIAVKVERNRLTKFSYQKKDMRNHRPLLKANCRGGWRGMLSLVVL